MKRLIIVCEGPTEQEFCTEVLGVEFAKHNIYVEAPVIKHSHGGIVPWATIKKQILNHLQEGDVYVSMLVDYYGIKDQFGFPGWEDSKEIVNKTKTILLRNILRHSIYQEMNTLRLIQDRKSVV